MISKIKIIDIEVNNIYKNVRGMIIIQNLQDIF